ncbi:MAG: DNA internalization-related competence protein ComEC/Rec2 [Ignavibacteriales bacterium]|nr:DNA internalization-related competence protein ComEC/Rec2 [Ignavibacteriales bacterium]
MTTSPWSRRPAVRAVLLFTSGIILSTFFRPTIISVFSAISILAALFVFSRVRVSSSILPSLYVHAVMVLLGLLLSIARQDQIQNDILGPRYFGERILIHGRIESEPVKRGARADMIVRTESIRRDSAEIQAQRRLLVQIVRKAHWSDPDSLAIGDRIMIEGYLEALPGARNPGEFDYGRYLALNGIQGFVTVRDTNSISLLARPGSFSLSEISAKAQNNIYSIYDRFHGQGEASFLKGVVFGYRGDLSAEVKKAFMDTGTIHILAVSGSNVVVVALIFYSLIGFLRVSPRAATGLTLVGLLWYMVMTGMSPSVVRATIMAGSILVGNVIGRKGDIYNSLAFAALVMLLWDPLYLLDVGFQLSFAAVLSIVYFFPKLEPLISLLPAKLVRITGVDSTLKLFAVSVAAQIGTLPFSAYYFGQVSPVSILANLVVVPVSGLNTLLGFATLGAAYISGWLASSYAALNDLLVSLLLKFVTWSASVPYAHMETVGVGAMSAVFYYATVAALFNRRNPRVVVWAFGVILLGMNVSFYAEAFTRRGGMFTVTVIDVGQGDALLLEFPNNRRVMIDAGPTYSQGDAAQRTIAPYLKKRGIRALDALILSHPHDDHIGGCISLLKSIRVGSLIVADTAPVSKSYEAVLSAVRERGIPISVVRAGESLQFDPATRIFVLQPGSVLAGGDLNNQSLVLKTCYGSTSSILTGDASTEVEDRILRTSTDLLMSDVLKVAHHGAATSSSEGFLKAVRPSLALISVGRLNKFKHPSRAVLSRYGQLGIPIRRTDLDGAVILQSDGMKIRLIPWIRSGLI